MTSQVCRVLIVENNSQRAKKLFGLLGDGREAFDIVHARSLEEGMTGLSAESVDVWLIDGSSGDDRTSEIEKIPTRFDWLPIVVILPQEKEALGHQFLRAGVSDLVLKEELGSSLLRRVLQSVVERKRLEIALRQSEERFQELFENAHDMIFTLDTEGNFTSINNSAVQIMGWSKEEAKKLNLKQIVAPEHLNVCRQMMSRIVNEEPMPQFEISVFRKDGEKVILEASARLIRSGGQKESVQGIARDVTERRYLENVVRQSQKLDAIGRLSGGLAHDFNNLLCVICGNSELLSQTLEPEHPANKKVAQIKKAADSASALVRQLLAFSRKQIIHPQVLDLNAIVMETERLLGRLVGKDIEFCTVLEPQLGRVRLDPVQVEQVIINLVHNARDAMPQGGKLTLETSNADLSEGRRTGQSVIPAGKFVVLEVKDNGVGMDEETQNRLFEPFYTTKERGKGTGLGLATVYGIVRQSGGSISVHSESGQGTSVKIYFPRVDATAEELQKVEEEDGLAAETVLLVENSDPLRALVKEFLRSDGYAVLEAANGKDAIRIAKAFGGPIHLLLTDVIMPGMGGKELAGKFASLRPGTKTLFMSGYSDESIVNSGLPGARMLFLEKPFTRDMILQKVRLILDELSPRV
jgi:two-component system, cell cycle sensor histidine kinase and response regulator CckA